MRTPRLPSVIGAGIFLCIWFGVYMFLNLWFRIGTSLFPPIPDALSVIIGTLAVALGIAARWRGNPHAASLGVIASVTVCGVRGVQAWQTGNIFAVGVWAILLGATAWAMLRPREEGSP